MKQKLVILYKNFICSSKKQDNVLKQELVILYKKFPSFLLKTEIPSLVITAWNSYSTLVLQLLLLLFQLIKKG